MLAHPITYLGLSVGLLFLDLLTGKFLMFPIEFVVPVALSAWYCSPGLAYLIAVMLPVGRFPISAFVELRSSVPFALANAGVRIAVLVLLAYLVARVARLTRELQKQVDHYVTICAWSKTVEYQGEWISFEEYLGRRFNVVITHGISPAEAERALAELDGEQS